MSGRRLDRRSLLRVAGLGALASVGSGCGRAVASPSPTPAVTPAPFDVSVLTYNIMTANKTWISGMPSRYNGDLPWRVRGPVVLAKMLARDPDIICLQENEGMPADGVKQVTYLAQHAPGYTVSPAATPEDTVQILFRTSQFTYLNGGSFRINTQGLNGAPKDRWCVWVKLQPQGSARSLFVFTVHLTSTSNLVRARLRSYEWDQLLIGLQRLNPGLAEPYVLAGDFNAKNNETRPVFNDHLLKMAAAGIADTSTTAESVTTIVPNAQSFNLMGGPVDGTWRYGLIRTEGFHLDYICSAASTMVKESQVVLGSGLNQGVRWLSIGQTAHPFFAEGPIGSDHNPIFAELTFPVT